MTHLKTIYAEEPTIKPGEAKPKNKVQFGYTSWGPTIKLPIVESTPDNIMIVMSLRKINAKIPDGKSSA